MGGNKYRSVLRARNALLLLAVALAAGVALTGWMTFSAPPEDPGTEESGPPASLSPDPFAESSAGLPVGDPSAAPSGDPSPEVSASGEVAPTLGLAGDPSAEVSDPGAGPSGDPSAEVSDPGAGPSGDPSPEVSALGEESENTMEVAP